MQCSVQLSVCYMLCAVFSVPCAVCRVFCDLWCVLCALCHVLCDVFSVQCAVGSFKCSVCRVQCAMYCVLCVVLCVLCAVCFVICAVCCVLCAICCVMYSVCRVQWAMFSVQCAVSSVLCAVCCVLCAVCHVTCAMCCAPQQYSTVQPNTRVYYSDWVQCAGCISSNHNISECIMFHYQSKFAHYFHYQCITSLLHQHITECIELARASAGPNQKVQARLACLSNTPKIQAWLGSVSKRLTISKLSSVWAWKEVGYPSLARARKKVEFPSWTSVV